MKTRIENNTLFIEVSLLPDPEAGPRLKKSGATRTVARSGQFGGYVKTDNPASERPVLVKLSVVIPVESPGSDEEQVEG